MKLRLDKYLVDNDYCRSRAQAQELINQGLVEIQLGANWSKAAKASQILPPDTPVRILDNELQKYVSRGALKLAGALDQCGLNIEGMHVIDVGQSTGGFTQVVLERGAARVTGIEVGHDQLAEILRQDSRVNVYEGVNARDLQHWIAEYWQNHPEDPGLKSNPNATETTVQASAIFDLAVMDVSFISQTQILPGLSPLLVPGGYLVSLVKPQFEVGPKGLGKGGIVNDARLYDDVEQSIRDCCRQHELNVLLYFDSPIQGGDGNREFFVVAQKLSRT